MGLKPALQLESLEVKRGRNFKLVIDSLEVLPGRILSVTGPNGSGKTTLLETLAGLTKPDRGEVKLGGQTLSHNLRQTKASLGFIPDDDSWFVAELTAREYFRLLGKVYEDAGRKVQDGLTEKLAARLYFSSWDQALESLSHGNKKKVQIIAGLMHSPAVIVVDELRNGLDPLAIIAAEKLIRDEAKRGASIVAATHDLWWAERVADEILLLNDGEVAIKGRKQELVRRFGSLERLFLKLAAAGV